MQRRYCRCGRAILVKYRPCGPSWQALFYGSRHLFRSRLTRCPHCGDSLDIDRLS